MGCIQSQSAENKIQENIHPEYDPSDAMVWEEAVPNMVEEKPENQKVISHCLIQTTQLTPDLIQILNDYLFSLPPTSVTQRTIRISWPQEKKEKCMADDFCECKTHYPILTEMTKFNGQDTPVEDIVPEMKRNLTRDTHEISLGSIENFENGVYHWSYYRIMIPKRAPPCIRGSSFLSFYRTWSDSKQTIDPTQNAATYLFKNVLSVPARLIVWDCDPGQKISGFFYVNGYGHVYHLNLFNNQLKEIYLHVDLFLTMVRIPKTGFLVSIMMNEDSCKSCFIVVICPKTRKEIQKIECLDPKFRLIFGSGYQISMKIDTNTYSVHVKIHKPPQADQTGETMIWTCVLPSWFFAPTCPCCLVLDKNRNM